MKYLSIDSNRSNKILDESFYLKIIDMKKLVFSLFSALLFSGLSFSQEFSGKVLDQKTKQPVPFVTIQYAKNKGVITNEEGVFVINKAGTSLDTLVLSSVGYEPQKVKSSELKDGVIYLKSQVIQLGDVFLSDKKLTGREILERAKEKVSENYNIASAQRRFFFRESNVNHVKRFDLDIQESSIADIDQKLMDSISRSIPKTSDSYKEVLGDFTGGYSSQKIELIKGANLYNPQNTASLNKLIDKLDQIFKNNVKPDSYLKIKSGLLGVKVDVDEIVDEREKEKKKPTPEEIAKSEADKKNSLVSSANSYVSSLLKNSFWNEDNTFNLFDKLNKYEYDVTGYTYLDSHLVYVIEFKPKGNADFTGKIYVNTEDFGVHRIDYKNVKPLKKFRLLGISTSDDVYRGKMIFARNDAGKYSPKYIEREQGESFGIDRPLKLIEKNKNVLGRRKQNELDMDILIKVSQLEKYQLVVYSEMEDLPAITKSNSEAFEYKTMKKYDPDFWKGYNIIEPNTAIKEFTAIQTK